MKPTTFDHLSDNLKGASFMALGQFSFVTMDVVLRQLLERNEIGEVMVWRGVFVVVLFLVYAKWRGVSYRNVSRRDWTKIWARGACEATAGVCFFYALTHMPFATLAAITQLMPITVALSGALFFGEHIGWRRILAILFGFIGVLLIVKPNQGLNLASMAAFVTLFLVTLRELITRRISKSVPTLAISTVSGVAGFAAGLILVTFTTQSFHHMPKGDIALIFLASCIALFAYTFAVKAMRIGEIDFVSLFRYTSLLFALIFGFVIFHESQDVWSLLGMSMIVMAGAYTIIREHRVR